MLGKRKNRKRRNLPSPKGETKISFFPSLVGNASFIDPANNSQTPPEILALGAGSNGIPKFSIYRAGVRLGRREERG